MMAVKFNSSKGSPILIETFESNIFGKCGTIETIDQNVQEFPN